MYGVELYAAVRLAVVEEGLSHHEAGRRFGIDRRTVKKMLSYSAPPGYRRTKPVRRPKLDGFTGIVDAILEADTDPEVPRKQPVMVWGGPGCGKSEVAQQVAAEGGRTYYDVRALLLDPVDLRGIPWRDDDNRTRWAPPDFLPPTDSTALYLVNLEELPSGVPHGAGGAVPARPRPQVRRVRAPRRRLAHGLRQPRGRPRRHAGEPGDGGMRGVLATLRSPAHHLAPDLDALRR